jgi:hypothetical protein
MLLVKTYVSVSDIAGVGLFAGEDLPKGTLVWRENPAIDISFKSFNSLHLSTESRKQLEAFTYFDANREVYILCGDNARFMNHSEEPNCDEFEDDGFGIPVTQANRDIKAGEELTIDYRQIHTGDLGF